MPKIMPAEFAKAYPTANYRQGIKPGTESGMESGIRNGLGVM